jgi:hypothetical protein
MFGFLNSTILLAGLAALIPLAIHLFSRRRVKVIEFSSLRHLKEMEKRQLRRLKIRQWLLLVLRMLIVLVAVLAFARPTAREGGAGSHAAVSAVILLDNSASMNRSVADGDLFELTRRRTTQLLETFSQSDEVALIELDQVSDESSAGLASASAALVRLNSMSVGSGPAQLEQGLESAVELLTASDNFNREVYLIGDRQRASLPESDPLRDTDIPLYLVDIPIEENDNLGLVAVDFGGQLIWPGHDFDLVATVRNYGRRDSDDRIASLYLDGRRVAQADVSVVAGGEAGVRFTQAVAGTGFHSGYVELTDDHFSGDNRYYFSFRIPDQSNLLIIDADPIASLLALALVPDQTLTGYWSVKQASPESLSGVNFLSYDVIILAGAPTLSETQVRRLQAFVRRGGALAITYGARTDIDYFNRTWSDLTGVRYQSAAPQNFTRAGYYSFDQIDLNHPIFQPFGFDQNEQPEIKFYALPRHAAAESADVLMTFTGGQPALVEHKFGRGKVITFCGPMSPEYSDLASHGFFVPLVSRLVEYLGADLTSLETRLFAGQAVTRALMVPETVGYQVDLVLPDQSRIRVAPEEDNGSLVVRTATPQAGIYSLAAGGRELDRWAVNINPAECDLTAVDPDQVALSLGTDEFRQLPFDQPMEATIADFRVGRELWQLFLWAAVVLMAVEAMLGRRSAVE